MTTALANPPTQVVTEAGPAPMLPRPMHRWDAVPSDGQVGPIRVLVVDDDQMLRSAVVDLLGDLGFSVVGDAEDGERGVSLAAEYRPGVILMDLRMPGIDGIEATRMIRHADARAQVVIYSAYSDAGFQAGAEDAGVTCYLVKGCGPGILADVLRSAGSLHRQLDARASMDIGLSEAGRASVIRPDGERTAAGLRVLVIDDDAMMREALSETLSEAGFDVVRTAVNGEEGVALAAELVPDAVLLDLRMAGIDGIEACRRIRSVTPRTHVVILSAYDEPGLRRQATDSGATGYVVKGSPPDRIFEALRGRSESRSA